MVSPGRLDGAPARGPLEPSRSNDHVEVLYRAAYALCGSQHEGEALAHETLSRVLKRSWIVRRHHELEYLLRALRKTHARRRAVAERRPPIAPTSDHQARATPEAEHATSEIMQAIASAPPPHRDAVIAVDLVGLSCQEAARALGVRQATITSRLHRGRQHIARFLIDVDLAK